MTVSLLTGRYEAALPGDRDAEEWPPHPARVFCALLSAARTEPELAALRWLEAQEPPTVRAAAPLGVQRRQSYVVTNSRHVKARGGSLTHPARTNQLRARVGSAVADPTVQMTWAARPPHDTTVLLDGLARRVPYLGRSTGIALVAAHAHTDPAGQDGPAPAATPDPPGTTPPEVYEPCHLAAAEVSLRVPYPGYLDDLAALHEEGRPAWEVSRSRGYRRRTSPAAPATTIVPSAYTDLVTFRFAGLRPDGRLTARFTDALRGRVMAHTPGPLPAPLHGHDADGRPHVAFLAMPDVGSAHADGHLLGLAVAIPDLPPADRRSVLRGVLAARRSDDTLTLRVPGIGAVELLYQPGLVRPWGARPHRWRQGSRNWVSATPVVLDRYPKKGREADEVRRSCRTLGLPDPVEVTVSPQPLAAGAVRLRPGDLPEQARGRLFRHVHLVFDRPVSGPLMLGAGRYLGVGLLAPIPDRGAA
jgi:CRISPR-associated protein Csb2